MIAGRKKYFNQLSEGQQLCCIVTIARAEIYNSGWQLNIQAAIKNILK